MNCARSSEALAKSSVSTSRNTKKLVDGCLTSLIAWFFQRETFPRQIRIATGVPEGLYHKVGSTIRESLEKRISSSIEVLGTEGSEQNFEKLVAGEVDLAIIQGGSYDNNLLCIAEKEVFVVESVFAPLMDAMRRAGAVELNGREIDALTSVAITTVGRELNEDVALQPMRTTKVANGQPAIRRSLCAASGPHGLIQSRNSMSISTSSLLAAARVTVRMLAAVRPRRPMTRPRSPSPTRTFSAAR